MSEALEMIDDRNDDEWWQARVDGRMGLLRGIIWRVCEEDWEILDLVQYAMTRRDIYHLAESIDSDFVMLIKFSRVS